jgi:thiamine pyrophosphokinase
MEESYALLICNGEQAPADRLRELAARAAYIVCADGGANVARALGILPAVILGDFDSMTRETRRHFEALGVKFLLLSRQDDTDFEKALLHLRESAHHTVVISGITGGLLDHTLGNMSILLRYSRNFRFILLDPHYRMDIITESGTFRCRRGDRISVVPLDAASGVGYKGLKYPLPSGELAPGLAEGTCNEALGDEFSIDLRQGTLIVFRRLHEELLPGGCGRA